MAAKAFHYQPDGKVLTDFFFSQASVSVIQGPVGCLSAETEVLTDNGWLAISDWDGQRIGVWSDGHLSMEYPEAYIDAPCDQMWHFKNEHALSMIVSDEHRMPLYDRDEKFRVRIAADVAAKPGRYRVPINFERVGALQQEARLRLHCAIAADGCLPKRGDQVVICVRKDRKKDRLRVLLADAGVTWQEFPHSTRETELTFAFPRETWMTKRLAIWALCTPGLRVVLDEVQHWDGLYEGPDERFDTTDKEAADFIQFAAHATGRRATISKTFDQRNAAWAPMYSVHISQPGSPKGKVGLRGDTISIERVRAPGGRKYCFTTSSGFFLARHNGCVFVTGNSGTSTACCHRMFRHALEQRPDGAGVRRTRWVIVRNTYSDLKETTLKTWKYWFEQIAQGMFGEVKMSNPPSHEISWQMPDGTRINAEFVFLALDQEDDVRKLLSMEMTGVWFNEAQFTDKAIFDAAHSRAMQGRYPPKLDGGPTWKGVLCDLNAPPDGHWIPYMRGDIPMPDEWDDDERQQYIKPDGWEFLIQPSGLLEVIEEKRVVGYTENPKAENTKWLTESYQELIKGKPKTWIDTYVMNRVGVYRKGRPVFESFRPEVHVAKDTLEYYPNLPLVVGLDFARNPAMAVTQMVRGQLRILFEYGLQNYSATTYAPMFKQQLLKKFPNAFHKDGAGIRFWGDPSGDNKGQGTDDTPFKIFMANGMPVAMAPGNNSISIRLNAVQGQLDKMIAGAPGFLVDPSCRTIKAGMGGGYHFGRIKGQSRYHDQPDKGDTYADYCDAVQYAALGHGLGTAVLTAGGLTPKPTRLKKKQFSIKRR